MITQILDKARDYSIMPSNQNNNKWREKLQNVFGEYNTLVTKKMILETSIHGWVRVPSSMFIAKILSLYFY